MSNKNLLTSVKTSIRIGNRIFSKEIRKTIGLGFPIAIALVAQTGISFTDIIILGKLDISELAGASLGIALFTVIMLVSLGVITAVSPQLSAAYSRGNKKDLRKTYQHALWLALIVSIPGMICLIFTEPLLVLMGQPIEIAKLASKYNYGAVIGLPAFLGYVALRCFLSSIELPKFATFTMIGALPINAILTYVLTLGLEGTFMGFGSFGAGL